jgi:hypothetical protein
MGFILLPFNGALSLTVYGDESRQLRLGLAFNIIGRNKKRIQNFVWKPRRKKTIFKTEE